MPLLNYTTKISTDRTVGEIQKMLAKAGAKAILSEYDNEGEVSAVSFKMLVNGNEVCFQLPIAPEKVLTVLRGQRGVETRYKTPEQAKRVAWRIIKDWVEAQLAIIETQMVKPEQVFLPYAITQSGETLYESVVKNQLLGTGEQGCKWGTVENLPATLPEIEG